MKLYGKNPVIERIKAAPGSIKNLYLRQKTDLSDIVKAAKAKGIKFVSLDAREFSRMEGEAHSQGVMAEVSEFEYAPFEDILDKALRNETTPVFIDGLTDPQNLGAIIRTLACMGGFSIVLPEHESVHVTETVLRVACGGENYVPVSRIVNSVRGITKAKEKGIFIAGAVAEGGKDIQKANLVFPIAIVIGSEGKGIRPGIEKHLDEKVSLPMEGARLSYNAAIATSLISYEVKRRKPALSPME